MIEQIVNKNSTLSTKILSRWFEGNFHADVNLLRGNIAPFCACILA